MSAKAIAVKKKTVDNLKELLDKSNVIVVSEYQGFNVKQVTELRKKLRVENSEFKVVKNTLIERAFKDKGYDELNGHLKGSTALLLGYKDAMAPLKILVKFMKDNEKGSVKAGIFDKTILNGAQLLEVSKLPTKEVLLGKMLGGLQAPLYGMVNVLQGPIRKLVYALDAINKKKGGE